MHNNILNSRLKIYSLASLFWIILITFCLLYLWSATQLVETIEDPNSSKSEITTQDVKNALIYIDHNSLTAPTVTDTLNLSLPESTPSGVTEGR